jgi:hypothetical protein
MGLMQKVIFSIRKVNHKVIKKNLAILCAKMCQDADGKTIGREMNMLEVLHGLC